MDKSITNKNRTEYKKYVPLCTKQLPVLSSYWKHTFKLKQTYPVVEHTKLVNLHHIQIKIDKSRANPKGNKISLITLQIQNVKFIEYACLDSN